MNKQRKPTGSRPNTNGVHDFNEQLEQYRMTVVELEYKARYWKAQWEIRHWTLEAEKLQAPYEEYMEVQRVKNEELQAQFKKEMEEMKKQMIEKGQLPPDEVVTPVAEEDADKKESL